jgi:uncharacterized protein (UPF0147 family)
MNISEFRTKYLEKIENDVKRQSTFRDFLNDVKSKKIGIDEVDLVMESNSVQDDVTEAVSILRDQSENVDVRIAALNNITFEIGQSEELIELLFSILANSNEAVNLRSAVLSICGELQFSSTLFRMKRAQFLDILRIIVDDPNPELSQTSIEELAKLKDEYIQRRLLEGLENLAKPLVRPEKAIQLLGYDVHSEYFPVLKQIAKKSPNLLAKNEAVRLLAVNPKAKDLLAGILQDKDESKRIRQTSAIALKSSAPGEFNKRAEQIILDDTEYEDIRATCINILMESTDFPQDSVNLDFAVDSAAVGSNELLEKIKQLKETATTKELRKAADRYLSKYVE